MQEKTSDVHAIVNLYGGLEFIPLRIQDAFDPSWWKSMGRDSVSLGVDMTAEGMLLRRNHQ